MPQSLAGNCWYFGPCGAGFGGWSLPPFFNFHFGGAETGSTADRDWFAECPSGIGRDAGAEFTASEGVQYTMLGELDFFDCGFAASHAATNDAGINRRCYNENPILRSCSPQE